MVPVSMGQESGCDLAGSSAWVSHGQGIRWGVLSSGSVTREGSTSKLPQFVWGGVSFLVVVEFMAELKGNTEASR